MATKIIGYLVEMHPPTSWDYAQTSKFLESAKVPFGQDCDYWSRYPVHSATFTASQKDFLKRNETLVSVREVYEGQEIYSYRASRHSDAYSIRDVS